MKQAKPTGLRAVRVPPVRARARGLAGSATSRALFGTAIGNAPGFVLPFVIAHHFGIGRMTDAYAFAVAVAIFGAAVASGVIESNVLPSAQRAKSLGCAAFAEFLRNTSRQAVGMSLFFIPMALASGVFLYMRRGWTGAQRDVAIVLIAEFVVLVALVAWNSVGTACLYSLDAFVTPASIESFRALVPLIALPFLGTGRGALIAVGALMVAGEAGRTAALRAALAPRIRRLPVERSGPSDLRVWRFAAPHALNMLVLSANPVIDRVVATSLSAGALTTLDLSEKVFYVPTVIIASSVILVASARWAEMGAREDHQTLRNDYRRTAVRTFAISVALAAVVGGASIAAEGLAGSTFAGSHARSFVLVTLVLLVSLPFMTLASLGGRLLTATRRTSALPIFAVVIVASNMACDIVGARLGGVVGIAAASVIAQAFAAVLFTAYCTRTVIAATAARPARLMSTDGAMDVAAVVE